MIHDAIAYYKATGRILETSKIVTTKLDERKHKLAA